MAEEEAPNTTYISQVLDRLTDMSKYDKRLRPYYGERPVMVAVTVHVTSISAVSEVDMDFTLDFYLRYVLPPQQKTIPCKQISLFAAKHGSIRG